MNGHIPAESTSEISIHESEGSNASCCEFEFMHWGDLIAYRRARTEGLLEELQSVCPPHTYVESLGVLNWRYRFMIRCHGYSIAIDILFDEQGLITDIETSQMVHCGVFDGLAIKIRNSLLHRRLWAVSAHLN